jgi:hypothetical protein
MKTLSTFSYTPYFSLEVWNGVVVIIITSKRSIRLEVITYRLEVAFGSQHIQQLHGFDELLNDQVVVRKRSTAIDTKVVSLYFPLAKKNERMEKGKNRFLLSLGWRSR